MDVAIIGGGPSGLIALDALIKENVGFNIKLFERRDKIGGCWNVTPPGKISFTLEKDDIPNDLPCKVSKSKINRNMDTAAYDYLETNVEATAMEFSIEKFPNTIKSRQGYSEFRHHKDILSWMETNFAKYEYIHLNTSLELIEKIDNKWRLVLRSFGESNDFIYEEFFDKVIIATGHFDVPYIPKEIKGLQNFKGILIHSKHFRDRNLFKDKKTIVVGSSVSAMDAIRDILPVVKKPAITSQRSKDHVYFGNDAFHHPDILIHNEIEKIEDNTVYYKDGKIDLNVDAILLATGFLYDYPFLKKIPDLYEMIFNIEDKSMAFVGAITPGLTFKLFEWQAVLVAKEFAGRSNLPKRLYKNKDEVGYDFKSYFETLRYLAGDSKIGRQLPKFDENWEKCFYRGHEFRKNMFKYKS